MAQVAIGSCAALGRTWGWAGRGQGAGEGASAAFDGVASARLWRLGISRVWCGWKRHAGQVLLGRRRAAEGRPERGKGAAGGVRCGRDSWRGEAGLDWRAGGPAGAWGPPRRVHACTWFGWVSRPPARWTLHSKHRNELHHMAWYGATHHLPTFPLEREIQNRSCRMCDSSLETCPMLCPGDEVVSKPSVVGAAHFSLERERPFVSL